MLEYNYVHYEDVIDLYREGDIIGECPISIEFKGEMAKDLGGVQRDMFSEFWDIVYGRFFEGTATLSVHTYVRVHT